MKFGQLSEIEVALGHLDEANNVVDRAEAGAEVERTGAFFLHLNGEILAASHAGLFRISFDPEKYPRLSRRFLLVSTRVVL